MLISVLLNLHKQHAFHLLIRQERRIHSFILNIHVREKKGLIKFNNTFSCFGSVILIVQKLIGQPLSTHIVTVILQSRTSA